MGDGRFVNPFSHDAARPDLAESEGLMDLLFLGRRFRNCERDKYNQVQPMTMMRLFPRPMVRDDVSKRRLPLPASSAHSSACARPARLTFASSLHGRDRRGFRSWDRARGTGAISIPLPTQRARPCGDSHGSRD